MHRPAESFLQVTSVIAAEIGSKMVGRKEEKVVSIFKDTKEIFATNHIASQRPKRGTGLVGEDMLMTRWPPWAMIKGSAGKVVITRTWLICDPKTYITRNYTPLGIIW